MRAAFWKIAGVLVVSLIGVEVFWWNTATAEDAQPAQLAVEPTPSTPRTAAVRKPATPQPEIGAPTQYRERRKPQGNSASKISNTTLSVSGGSARTATSSGKPKTSPSAGSLGPISQMPHPRSVSDEAVVKPRKPTPSGVGEGTPTAPIGSATNVSVRGLGPISQVPHPKSTSAGTTAGANGRTTANSAEATAQRGESVGAISLPHRSADFTKTLSDPSFNAVTANPQTQNAAARGLDVSPSSSLTTTQPTQSTQSATPGTDSNTGRSGVSPGSEAATASGSLSHPSDMPTSLISPNSTPPETERSDQVLNATGLRNTLLSRDMHDPSVSDNSEEGSLPAGSDLKKGNLTGMGADIGRGEDVQSAPKSGIGSTSAAPLSPPLAVTAAPIPSQNVGAQSSEIQAGTHYLPTASSSDVTGLRGYTSPSTIGPDASTSLGSITTSPILFCLPFFPFLLLIYFGLRLS